MRIALIPNYRQKNGVRTHKIKTSLMPQWTQWPSQMVRYVWDKTLEDLSKIFKPLVMLVGLDSTTSSPIKALLGNGISALLILRMWKAEFFDMKGHLFHGFWHVLLYLILLSSVRVIFFRPDDD